MGWTRSNQFLAGLGAAFFSPFSSERVMANCCLPCSLPEFFLALDFLPFLDLESQQPAALAPWQQEDLLLVHSVLAFLSEAPVQLWADAVAPNRNRAPRRRMCFMTSFVAIKIGSTNFSGKLIAGGVLLLFFTLILLEGFGLNELLMQ